MFGVAVLMAFREPGNNFFVDALMMAIFLVFVFGVLFRVGLLPFLVMGTVQGLLIELPLSASPTDWYSGITLLVLAIVLGVAVYGFRVALAGRPAFGDELPVDLRNDRASRAARRRCAPSSRETRCRPGTNAASICQC